MNIISLFNSECKIDYIKRVRQCVNQPGSVDVVKLQNHTHQMHSSTPCARFVSET